VLASAELEASSRGAALLALEALGALERPLEALPPPTGHVHEPISEHTQRYRAAAQRQRRLYEQLVLGR
jgi:sugar (pentulose or hexulose) kinase